MHVINRVMKTLMNNKQWLYITYVGIYTEEINSVKYARCYVRTLYVYYCECYIAIDHNNNIILNRTLYLRGGQ